MHHRLLSLKVSAVLLLVLAGCGSSSSTSSSSSGSSGNSGTVNGTASFFNGATPVGSSSSSKQLETDKASSSQGIPSDGTWLLSPDKMTLTLTAVSFTGTASSGSKDTISVGSSSLNCAITYDRSQVGLTKIVDCPFTVNPGIYTSLSLTFNSTYQVLINDSTNGFYTTSSGIVTGSAPSGGAQSLSVTTGSSGSTFGNTSNLATPLTITSGNSVTLSVVISGLQFFHVNVSSGAVSLGWPGTNFASDPFRPDMTASVTSLAKLGFYVTPQIGTALSYNVTTAGATGITSVSVYYASATTPTFLVLGLNGTPATCSPIGVASAINGPPNKNTLGGYLGLDSTGILGWAVPTDTTWSTYAAEFNMAQVSTLQGTTKLNCKKISTDPAPPGGTFTSGAPNINSADYTTSMVLVAQ